MNSFTTIVFGLLLLVNAARADITSTVHVAGLKLIPVPRDKAGNYAKFEKYAREAAAAGANLIITSEGYLDGYVGDPKRYPDMTPEKLWQLAEADDGVYVRRTVAMAKELHVHIIFGLSERRGKKVYNTALIISPDGKIIGRYSKSHPGEEIYEPGNEFPVFDTSLGRIGILICFDRQPPEPARILALKGAQMILVPTNSRNVEEINEDLTMRVRAYENNVFAALVSPFNTLMVDSEGNFLARNAQRNDEGIVYAQFDLSKRAAHRDSIDRRRPEVYGELLKRTP
jgi:5-aminopentanamidase